MTQQAALAVINGDALTKSDIMSVIDDVLLDLQKTGNLDNADRALQALNRVEEVSGLAKAKLLHGIHAWWQATNQDEARNDTFWDYIEVQSQEKKTYAKRLITVWEYQDQMPKEIRNRPVKDQIPVAQALRQEWDFEKKDWDDLVKASSNGEILEIVRRVKGKPERKGSMQLKLARDGTINAWVSNKKHFVGFLNVKESKTDPVIATAIERIINNTGMIEQ